MRLTAPRCGARDIIAHFCTLCNRFRAVSAWRQNKVFCQTFVHKSLRGLRAQTCALGEKPQHFNNLIIKPIVGLRSHILRKDPFVGAGMRRSDAPSPNILLNLAGLLSPRPRFLSCRKERNQRFAKEEVSSLDSPLEGHIPSGTSQSEVLSP